MINKNKINSALDMMERLLVLSDNMLLSIDPARLATVNLF